MVSNTVLLANARAPPHTYRAGLSKEGATTTHQWLQMAATTHPIKTLRPGDRKLLVFATCQVQVCLMVAGTNEDVGGGESRRVDVGGGNRSRVVELRPRAG
mmetsp:Transcript_7813/g.20791  ORF Transcript_7813/g.20791 Transcript_7813/m.20791 type:complete len:101 (+) Transcript_7813:1270-1572(+)